MRYSLACAALVAAAQSLDSIPQCAQPAIRAAIGSATSCSATDFACICQSEQELAAAASVDVIAACGAQTALNQVVPAVNKFCQDLAAANSAVSGTTTTTATATSTTTSVVSSPTDSTTFASTTTQVSSTTQTASVTENLTSMQTWITVSTASTTSVPATDTSSAADTTVTSSTTQTDAVATSTDATASPTDTVTPSAAAGGASAFSWAVLALAALAAF